MAQRTKRPLSAPVTVGFKIAQRYAAWVYQAAEARGLSASRYLEELVLPWVASDLGIDAAEVERALRPSPPVRDLIAEAAQRAGLTPRQYMAARAVDAARAELAAPAPAPAPASRVAAQSGTHRVRRTG